MRDSSTGPISNMPFITVGPHRAPLAVCPLEQTYFSCSGPTADRSWSALGNSRELKRAARYTKTEMALKTDASIRPFVFLDRIPLEFTALENQSEEGFMRDRFLYGVRARYRLTYGLWQHAVKVTFTDA
jgi:phage major head subunit gpT-like protein